MSRTDRAWLNRATQVARTSNERHKHGAILVRGGRVLASAVNRNRIDPETYLGETTVYSVHAEAAVIRKVTDARGAVLYVARVNWMGTQLSRPCDSCSELIINHEIKRVVWT